VTPSFLWDVQAGGLSMARTEAAKQFSFRLPENLIGRVEECEKKLRATGLELTRADVVRLLLKHALDATHCKIELLFDVGGRRRSTRK
jgi:hypothetical protein